MERAPAGTPELIVIPISPARSPSDEGTPDATVDLRELAEAVASSPWWDQMAPASLIVKEDEQSALGVLGRFDPIDRLRIGWLRSQIDDVAPRMVRLSWGDAEAACGALADRLLERFGRATLRNCRFVGIPRGGLIVLGMLAYLLDLDREQLQMPDGDAGPVVVVDDCVLSGYRFKEFTRSMECEIVPATLASSPQVRAAVEAADPRVVDFLSAYDLKDRSPERLGDGHAAWKDRWASRDAGSTYWVGQLDHMCFPWSEPDVTFWNEMTNRDERGWSLVPPASCLKHRGRRTRARVSVQMQPPARGAVHPASSVLFGCLGDELVVGSASRDTSVVLQGVAADMWTAVVEHGSESGAAASLAGSYAVDPQVLAEDLAHFTAELVERGLLQRDDPGT